MRSIAELESQISEAVRLLEETEARAQASPSADLSAASLSAHIKDLQSQLRAQKQRRSREVVELALRGSLADSGSLPLDLLGRISSELARALGHTARMCRFGTEGRILKEILNTLDLRLDGIKPGSARLFITGETAPDLFGRSLLEETLRDTFALLNASTADDLAEVVSRIGARAAGAFHNFFHAVGHSGLALEVNWESPSEEELAWSAEARNVRQLAETLSKLIPEEPEVVTVTGEIITVSARRPFELRGDDKIEYLARVPDAIANDIKEFKVGQKVIVTFERLTVKNQVTGRDKTTWILRGVIAA